MATVHKHLIGYTMGYTRHGKEAMLSVIVKIKDDGKRLSFVGSIGSESFGQIEKPEFTGFAAPWNQKDADKLWELWEHWHLNDMRAGCEHQRNNPEWDVRRKLTIHNYGWTQGYYRLRRLAESGQMDAEAYEEYKVQTQIVARSTLGLHSPKHPGYGAIADALARGLIEEKGTEEKAAGWVDYREHPDGLLSKPCPVCGYGYGTAWLFEAVPNEVIEWLNMKAQGH